MAVYNFNNDDLEADVLRAGRDYSGRIAAGSRDVRASWAIVALLAVILILNVIGLGDRDTPRLVTTDQLEGMTIVFTDGIAGLRIEDDG